MSGILPGSYTPNVPLGNQQINNTQQPIETNFQDIADLVAVNHIPFNTPDTFGKHEFVTYYNQTIAPEASTGQIVVFSQDTNNGVQLFYQYPNNSNIYPLFGGGQKQPSAQPAGTNIWNLYVNGSYGYTFTQLTNNIKFATQTQLINSSNGLNQIFNFYGSGGNFTQTPFWMGVNGFETTGFTTTVQSPAMYVKALSTTQFQVSFSNFTSGNSFQIFVTAIGFNA